MRISASRIAASSLLLLAAVARAGTLVDSTPPSCELSQTIAGPPKQFLITFQDTGSGLASIVITVSQNSDTIVPPFTVGTTDPVVVTATKIDQNQPMTVTLQTTDIAGNPGGCTFTDADSTPPSCALTQTIAGPPKQLLITFQDTGSGLASIVITVSQNSDTIVPPFLVGTTDPVVVTATKIDQNQPMTVTFQTTDVAGNPGGCTFTDADSTPPSCALTQTIAGPPKKLVITIQDAGSGLASISASKAANANVVVPPFVSGTTDPVVVTATKIDPLAPLDVIIESADVAGNGGSCEFTDPASARVPTLSGWALGAFALLLAAEGARRIL